MQSGNQRGALTRQMGFKKWVHSVCRNFLWRSPLPFLITPITLIQRNFPTQQPSTTVQAVCSFLTNAINIIYKIQQVRFYFQSLYVKWLPSPTNTLAKLLTLRTVIALQPFPHLFIISVLINSVIQIAQSGVYQFHSMYADAVCWYVTVFLLTAVYMGG